MIEPHDLCRVPEDENAILWRYMSLGKFLHLLSTKQAFFCRLDRLGDPFEGGWPPGNMEALREWYAKSGLPSQEYDVIAAALRKENTQSAVWCWHLNEHESAAMWRIYSHGDEGVAVRSSFARLRTSLEAAPHRIMLGAVSYLDFQTQRIVMPRGVITFAPAFHKRNSYAYEQEVRALVWYPQQIEGRVTDEEKTRSGIVVPVDLRELIGEVYVAPDASPWFREVIEDVVRQAALGVPIRQSDPLRARVE